MASFAFIGTFAFYSRARRKYRHCRFTDTDQHARTPPDHTSHIAAVSKVWTHSVAKVRLDEKGNIVECDRLTKAFIDTIG